MMSPTITPDQFMSRLMYSHGFFICMATSPASQSRVSSRAYLHGRPLVSVFGCDLETTTRPAVPFSRSSHNGHLDQGLPLGAKGGVRRSIRGQAQLRTGEARAEGRNPRMGRSRRAPRDSIRSSRSTAASSRACGASPVTGFQACLRAPDAPRSALTSSRSRLTSAESWSRSTSSRT